jgi:hypothetical protein
VVEGTRVVLAEPRVLESVGAIDFVRVREEEPEMTEGLVWDEFKLGKGVVIRDGPSKVRDEGSAGSLGEDWRPHGSGWVVKTGWHCGRDVLRVFIAKRGLRRW